MIVNYGGQNIEIKNKTMLNIDGLELVGDYFGKNEADMLKVGSWNEKYIRNFLYLLSLIRSQPAVDLSALYTKNEVDTLIDDRISFLIGSAPQNLDTLYEISMRLEEDSGAISQILNLLSQKADRSEIKDFPIGFVRLVPSNIPADSNYLDILGQTLNIADYPALASFLGVSYYNYNSTLPVVSSSGVSNLAAVVDPSSTTYGYSNAGVSPVFDLGSVKSASKISIRIGGTNYSGAAITVRVSSDGNNWTSLGSYGVQNGYSSPYSYTIQLADANRSFRYVSFLPNTGASTGDLYTFDLKIYDVAVSQFSLPRF